MSKEILDHITAMSANDAHNYLMRLGLPDALRVSLTAMANEQRRKLRRAQKRSKLANLHHAELWHRLIAPLKAELSNAKVGQRLKPFEQHPERFEAFAAYIELMEKLLGGLQKIQQREAERMSVSVFLDADIKTRGFDFAMTPTEIAVERSLPHKGTHWSDWVGESTKARIQALFDSVPYTPKSKRFTPFKRRIPLPLFKQLREGLQKRTLHELDIVEQEIELLNNAFGDAEIDPDDQRLTQRDKLESDREQMLQVLYAITVSDEPIPLPATWHGLAGVVHAHRKADDLSTLYIIRDLRHRFSVQEEVRKKKSNRPARYRK